MTTLERIEKVLANQKKPGADVDEESVRRLLGDPDAEVDWGAIQDKLGYSSLQILAFFKGLNAEFGKDISMEEFENAKSQAEVLALLE